ncbi:MAG TPA: class I SAM-dependent methyltransferase, partial [Pseudonocardia sp.]
MATPTARPVAPPVAEPDWLDLREPADRRARSTELAQQLAAVLRPGPVRILDIGSGTGSTTRWLAPLLRGPQEWTLLDRDPALLALAPDRTRDVLDGDGLPVTVTTRHADIASLTARDLAETSAVTGSALTDLLTADEVDELASVCAAAEVPALLTLTVTGQVEIDPPDPVDDDVTAAFNAHQRRAVAGRTLLGPTAADVSANAFRRHGMVVFTAPSPWRLDDGDAALIARWHRERVAAAEHETPDASGRVASARRVNAAPRRAVVHHIDLL